MAYGVYHDDPFVYRLSTTLSTSTFAARETPEIASQGGIEWKIGDGGWPPRREKWEERHHIFSMGLGSTGKGILIGMLSAFGSAALVALIIAIVYFFRYTTKGRIFLDRIGRPGEFDDEQQFLREEEEAMGEMDELQRAEYLRAKGESILNT